MGLTNVAIARNVFIVMCMIGAILFGIVSFNSMRKEQNPEAQFGAVTISTVYPGAGPEEINTLISRKIEESISGINGLLEVTSSSQEGISIVVGNFEIGTNMDVALNDIRSKVDQINSTLPTEALKPVITKLDTTSEAVMTLALSSPNLNAQQLRDLCDDKIKDRFARIKGVAQVDVGGGDLREIQVRIRRDRLLSYGLGIVDVQRALQSTTLNVPSGRIIGPNQEFGVRVLGEFKSLDSIRNTIIRIADQQNPNNAATIKLSDIAEIEDTTTERREFTRLNGAETVTISVQKSREGNAIEISSAATAVIAGLQKDFGVTAIKTMDSATRISESLFDLNFALIFGVILVCAIVFLFLHDIRGTIIVALAIPTCLLATIGVLRMFGFTINNMSMLALSLAVGVLVDDAIVVLENIYRHLRMGEDPKTAALNGRGEIGLAAVAITFADIAVFLPMGFMGGVVGQFFRPLGIAFAVAVFLSLMVSFTITPMLAARWYKAGEDLEHFEGGFAGRFEKGFTWIADGYRRLLAKALKHRWGVFCGGFVALFSIFMMIGGGAAKTMGAAAQNTRPLMMLAIILGIIGAVVNSIWTKKLNPKPIIGGVLFGLMFPLFAVIGFMYGQWKGDQLFKFTFAPPSDQGQVTISLEMPTGTTLDHTLEVVKRLETVAMNQPDTEFVVSRVGSWSGSFAGAGGGRGTNLGQLNLTLRDKVALMDNILFWKPKSGTKLRSRADTAVAADLIEKIGHIPGANISVAATGGFGFGAPIQMSFASDDRALLQRTVENITNRLNEGEVPGVINPQISSKPGKPEYQAIPIADRAADANVTTADMASAMRMLYEGNDDVKFRVNGKEYPIRVMMDRADRDNPDLLNVVPVKFAMGHPIYLPQVAKIQFGTTVDKIERRNRQEEVRISANILANKVAGSTQSEINEWLTKNKLVPAGVVIKPLGQADVQAREQVYLFSTFVIGLVLVYMLLASLYNNYLYPLVIQLAQPQAFVGALLALVLTDKSLNIIGFIGLIALVGLVGKNAILLVDYTNTLRARGLERTQAILEAGPTRLRPITMTTLAIILGTLPTAMALGRGSEFRETLGIVIIGGIALSTMLTLLVIPCSYTLFDDFVEILGRIKGHFGKSDVYVDPGDESLKIPVTMD